MNHTSPSLEEVLLLKASALGDSPSNREARTCAVEFAAPLAAGPAPIGGRGDRLFVRGTDAATTTSFGDRAVYFLETLRKPVAGAPATPGQRVALTIGEETFYDGRAKRRVKHFLQGMRTPVAQRYPKRSRTGLKDSGVESAA